MRRRVAAHHPGHLGVAPDRPVSSGLNVTVEWSTVWRDCAGRLIHNLQSLAHFTLPIKTCREGLRLNPISFYVSSNAVS